MNAIELLKTLNESLPTFIATYKAVRDAVHEVAPATPAYADAELIELMGQAADHVVEHADTLLEKYRPT